jgi:predicted nucleotidyltransferase
MDTELHTTLRDMLRRYQLTAVYVFGSRAAEITARVTGASAQAGGASSADHPLSDVDIGVQPARGTRLSAEQRVRLVLELEDLFAVARVDLVVLPEANAPLAAEVVRGELLLCADPDEEAESQLYYLRRAGDLAPFYSEQLRELLGTAP